MSGRWSDLASSPKARAVTIALVAAQTGTFALDAIGGQPVIPGLLCPLPVEVYEAGAGIACAATLLLFFASPVAGLLGLRFAAFRPLYWALLLLVPIGIAGQVLLMHALGLDPLRIHHG